MNREALIAGFLARSGYAEARAQPLAPDASFRRYLRLIGGPRPAVLMDAPPPEDIRPFLRVAAHLAAIGLSVPEILAADEAAGLLLEEDLGDDLFPVHLSRLRERSASEAMPGEGLCAMEAPSPAALTRSHLSRKRERCTLFGAAVDVLITMQRAAPPPELPAWDAAAMASTALTTLLDWWWPAAFGAPATAAVRQDFASALHTMLEPVASGPPCFVHRDFFAGNLLWLPQRAGVRRVGVLDFQGAAIGHPAYDLASLLQDARRDIPAAVATMAIERYLTARPELDPVQFHAAYAACAAQRHLRVAAQWVRLARRDGRPGYLVHGPRTWRLLETAVRQPTAAPLAAALDRWIPPSMRGNPPGLDA